MPTLSRFQVLSAKLRQRSAELRRLPRLVGSVLPALLGARLSRRESLLHVLATRAQRTPHAPALLFQDQRTSYAELWARIERAAALLQAEGVRAGDVVGLLGRNSDAYVVQLLAAARLGAVVALLNPELSSEGLTQALRAGGVRAVLVEARLAALAPATTALTTWIYDSPAFAASLALARSAPEATVLPSGDQDFVYVYTSGTTGPSKPARLNHRRSLLAATAFGQMAHQLQRNDVVYCALPLHHASALLLGLGACVQAGATLALRERFSASALLDDVRRFEATVLLYIGELGRALLRTAPDGRDREHRLRLAVGNGLSAEVWPALQERFGIPQVCEFYAATDFPGAIVNITGTIGSVGHIVLARVRGYRLLRVDTVTGALVRSPSGRALECAAGETGELVLRLRASAGRATGVYGGYVEQQHTASRLLRDVFRAGDLYCRSGDLLRRDEAGHYWFVDRLGDSFRFKGENVASCEVEAAFAGTPGVAHVASVGVAVPGVDGRPGLLVVGSDAEPSLDELTERSRTLPHYARPCFVRVVPAIELTASLKLKKRTLAAQGVDPTQVSGPLYFWDGQRYAALDRLAFSRIVEGQLRL